VLFLVLPPARIRWPPPAAQPIKLKFAKIPSLKRVFSTGGPNFEIQGTGGSWSGAPAGRTWAHAPELGSHPRRLAATAPGEEAGPPGAEERSSSPAGRLPIVLPGRRRHRPLPGGGCGPSAAWDPRAGGAERISQPTRLRRLPAAAST
jgi:hypothetical protein